MARKRASMREGPLAELFRRTEAAQRAQEGAPEELPFEDEQTAETQPVYDARRRAALEETVEHVHDFSEPKPTPIVPDCPPVAAPPPEIAASLTGSVPAPIAEPIPERVRPPVEPAPVEPVPSEAV